MTLFSIVCYYFYLARRMTRESWDVEERITKKNLSTEARCCAGRSELHTIEVVHNGAFSWLRTKHSRQSIKQNNILSRQKGADEKSNIIANDFSYRRVFVLISKCARTECWRKVIPVGEYWNQNELRVRPWRRLLCTCGVLPVLQHAKWPEALCASV